MMMMIFLKGVTSESASLMCMSKKGETGKYEIMSQLEMDGIAVNIQNTENIEK